MKTARKFIMGICSVLAVSCMAVGGAALSSMQNVNALEQTDIVTAVEGYTSILPAGVTLGEYTVLDLDAKTFSTGINVQGDMGTHQAVRFQYNKTNDPWALCLGLYNDTNGYHKPYNSVKRELGIDLSYTESSTPNSQFVLEANRIT